MEYRKANRGDIKAFTENRLEFASSVRKPENPEAFKAATAKYLNEHIDKDDLIIMLAMDGEVIAASCMACLFETAPLPFLLSGKTAELLNVYTKEEYRRQGHAEKLLMMLMEESKKAGAEKMFLFYTDSGLPLYKKLGFTPMERHLEIRL